MGWKMGKVDEVTTSANAGGFMIPLGARSPALGKEAFRKSLKSIKGRKRKQELTPIMRRPQIIDLGKSV